MANPSDCTPEAKKSDEIVVFSILRESQCSECGKALSKGCLLRKEGDNALCLSCADLDHLVFLAAGNASLTRRASKYSTLRAVLVRYNRARERYERQGVLVEEAALERAERDCLDDAEARSLRRERDAERRSRLDQAYVSAFAAQIAKHFPGCPPPEQHVIAQHACERYSGRVGRSAAAKCFDPDAIRLAVQAYIRHAHTNYDELLARGQDRLDARAAIFEQVSAVLLDWQSGRVG